MNLGLLLSLIVCGVGLALIAIGIVKGIRANGG